MNPISYLETGVIYCEDNLVCLQAEFPDECVDLIYLDPPFFSNKFYEVIWGDEAEVRSFDDRWKGGIPEYVGWMRKRMEELHRVLKPTGSLYLHCDPTASHYLKVMLDSIFGQGNFRNEIVWKRTSGRKALRQFGRVHDVILFYTRSDDATWTSPTVSQTAETVRGHDLIRLPGGVVFRLTDLTAAETRNGDTGEPWRGIDVTAKGRHWAYFRSQLEEFDSEGRIHWPKRGGLPRLKVLLADLPGTAMLDVWTDLDPINSAAAERLGYPTQKPEALLQRIISASSNRGDVVLDPFCGCGTTIAVAQQMQRHWIGIDISPQAASIMKRRVDSFGARAEVVGMPATLDDLRQLGHFEFQNWVVDTVNGVRRRRKSGDLGIDGYSFMERHPIQVKQSERVGRNAVDNFETAIERDGKEVGYLVAFSFTRDAYDEAARSREVGNTSIHLVRVADLLDLRDLVMAARAARTEPDLSHVDSDLLELFRGATELRKSGPAKPPVSTNDLFESARKKPRSRQGHLRGLDP